MFKEEKKSNKAVSVIVAFLMLFCGFGAGYLIFGGDRIGARETANAKVAVVNQDQGAGKTNYAASILSQLDEAYVAESYESAKKGLNEGDFGAVVIFPEDFSKRVSKINANDVSKVKLQYDVSTNQTEKEYVDSYEKVYNVLNFCNTKLSNAYVSSVFKDVREGQGNVKNIESLNAKDLAAAKSLSLKNFTKEIKWSDMPKVKLDLGSISLEDYKKVNKSSTFTNDIKNIYETGYTKTYNDNKSEILSALSNINGDYSSVNSYYKDLSSDEANLRAYESSLSGSYSGATAGLSAYMSTFKSNVPTLTLGNIDPSKDLKKDSAFMKEIDSTLPDYSTGLADGTYKDGNDYLKKVNAYKKQVDAYKSKVDSYQNDIVTADANIKTYDSTVKAYITAGIKYMPNYGSSVPAPTLNIDDASKMSGYKAIPGSIASNKASMTSAVNKIAPSEVKNTVLNTKTGSNVKVKDEVESTEKSFRAELLRLNGDFANVQSGNASKLKTAKSSYDAHTSKIHQEAVTGYSKAGAGLSKDLKSFLALKSKNAGETSKDLKSINSALTYGNKKDTSNVKIIDFIAKPIDLEEIELFSE